MDARILGQDPLRRPPGRPPTDAARLTGWTPTSWSQDGTSPHRTPARRIGAEPADRGLAADRAYVTAGLSHAVTAHLAPRRPRTMVAAIAERLSRGVRDAPKALHRIPT
ncbi:hypothetical protein AB0953_31315 [Streptomyces sp. NPDC046866]|uniref:hypothetical protein n=1 Tax=Streptomyces sp. NPDC046866 TaxID=3154921 RepID=UPI003452A884